MINERGAHLLYKAETFINDKKGYIRIIIVKNKKKTSKRKLFYVVDYKLAIDRKLIV